MSFSVSIPSYVNALAAFYLQHHDQLLISRASHYNASIQLEKSSGGSSHPSLATLAVW